MKDRQRAGLAILLFLICILLLTSRLTEIPWEVSCASGSLIILLVIGVVMLIVPED